MNAEQQVRFNLIMAYIGKDKEIPSNEEIEARVRYIVHGPAILAVKSAIIQQA